MFFAIYRRYLGWKSQFESEAEKDGKCLFLPDLAAKLYISKTEIINIKVLNGVEKESKATLGKVAQSPIHWGMNWF